MPERQRSMVSALSLEAAEQRLIKPEDPENQVKKARRMHSVLGSDVE